MVSNKDKVLELDSVMQKIVKEFGCQFNSILPDNITPTQFFLLKLIYDNKDCKAADIAHFFGISPAAATNMVERLYRNNWIERIRSEEDRRVVCLKLNEKGEKLLKQIEERKFQMQLERFTNITDEELDALIAIFNKVLDTKI
ncbi:MAG: MarR family transcriptional regulator [Peptococcaceae bacterium BICA1-8]|nr:MAG: MarR family transcriptional regulator [Peptococcaceae bacterium BICA1-8]